MQKKKMTLKKKIAIWIVLLISIFILGYYLQQILHYPRKFILEEFQNGIILIGQTVVLSVFIYWDNRKQSKNTVLLKIEKSLFLSVWLASIWFPTQIINNLFKQSTLLDYYQFNWIIIFLLIPLYFIFLITFDSSMLKSFHKNVKSYKKPYVWYITLAILFSIIDFAYYTTDDMDFFDIPIRFINRIFYIALLYFLFTAKNWNNYEDILDKQNESKTLSSFFQFYLPHDSMQRKLVQFLMYYAMGSSFLLLVMIEIDNLIVYFAYFCVIFIIDFYSFVQNFRKLYSRNRKSAIDNAILCLGFFSLWFVYTILLITLDIEDLILVTVFISLLFSLAYQLWSKFIKNRLNFDAHIDKPLNTIEVSSRGKKIPLKCSHCHSPFENDQISAFHKNDYLFCAYCGKKIMKQEIFSPSAEIVVQEHEDLMSKLTKKVEVISNAADILNSESM
jgi:DNA-directed RNA polymerase subunit RPC12/RpoP